MRARVPGLILALSIASPALAGGDLHASGGEETARAPAAEAPRLSYAGADAPEPGDADCGTGCGPKLVYAVVDPSAEAVPAIIAASAPPPLPAFDAGAMRAGTDGTQLLAAVDSDGPNEQKLVGLVTIAAPRSAPVPVPAPARTPASPPAPAPAPAPNPTPPICILKPVCL